MKWITIPAAISLLFFSVAIIAQNPTADGKEVYAVQKCSLCHSINGNGGQRMALDGVGARLKPSDMKRWIRTPKDMKADTIMKSYPNLTPKDIDSLVEYLMTLK